VTPVNLNNPGSNPNNTSGLGFDPTMAKLMAITPNGQSDVGDGVSSLLFFPSPDSLNDYTLTGRLDYAVSPKHQLTVRYTYGHLAESNPSHDEVLPGIGNYYTTQTSHNGVISLASTLSSNGIWPMTTYGMVYVSVNLGRGRTVNNSGAVSNVAATPRTL